MFRGANPVGTLATLFGLLILLQILFKAKNREVVAMDNKFILDSLAVISGHLAAITGSALVTVALSP